MENDQDRMWRAMRIMKQFSLLDLQVTARGQVALLHEGTVLRYLNFLKTHGYVKSQKNWYKLIENTGPNAPQVRRDKALIDRNLNKTFLKPMATSVRLQNYAFGVETFFIKDLIENTNVTINQAQHWVFEGVKKQIIKKEKMVKVGQTHRAIYSYIGDKGTNSPSITKMLSKTV